jgi:23S rRNA (uridine2552-2'-O)-methyltransferase
MPAKKGRGQAGGKPGRKKNQGQRWDDHYTHKAKSDGFAARSVYKLSEIDKRRKLFKPGQRILDLGCHPGSWSKYAAQSIAPGGLVIGVDRNPTTPPHANVKTITSDIFNLNADFKQDAPQGFHAVLSDLAPDTTGIRDVDEARSLELAQRALEIALENLRPNGFFVVKIFQGPDFKAWLDEAKKSFSTHNIIRPEATRKKSREIFVLLAGFRGQSDADA